MAVKEVALGDVAGAALASVTPGMFNRLAEMAERAGTAVDIATSPEVLELLGQVRASAPALTHAIRRVDELTKSGALDSLLDLAQVLQAAQSSMGDAMIHRLGNLIRVFGEMADLLVVSGLPEKVPALMEAAEGAKAEAEADPTAVSLFGLMRALKQPEVQFALKFMLAMARRLPAAAAENPEV